MVKAKKQSFALNIMLIIIGVVLIGISIFYKPNNNTYIDEAGDQIVQAVSEQILPENDGKLVIVSGKIEAANTLKDEYFGVMKSTYKMARIVETYQWEKQCEADKCDYLKVWSEGINNTDDNEHKNPETAQFSNEEYAQTNLPLGEYILSDKLIHDIVYDTVMGPDEIAGIYTGSYKLIGEYITNSEDLDNPKIGDWRIHYEYAKDKKVTVVAKQAGNSFGPYYTSNKKEIYSIEDGEKTANEYLNDLEAQKSPFNMIVAIVGVFFTFLGLSSIVFTKLRKNK